MSKSCEEKATKSIKSKTWFNRFSQTAARVIGNPLSFAAALGIVLVWVVTGPVFGFSDSWQLVINTGTNLLTFLIVFIIQSTQNRDSEAMQLKLDELIRAVKGAHNVLLNLEELGQEDLDNIRASYKKLAEEARAALQSGKTDTSVTEIADGLPSEIGD